MKIHYDPQADAMYVTLRKGKCLETKEISDHILVDVDAKGNPLGIEILFYRKTFHPREMKSIPIQWTTSKKAA